MSEYILRLETPDDYRATEELTRRAFWGVYKEGCDEHFLAHRLRQDSCFVPELDYVAELDGKLIGSIMYSAAKIIDGEDEHEVLTFGPISVDPEYQNTGVGSALINKTADLARGLGYRGIVIFGHSKYYRRFGFKNAEVFSITTPNGDNFEDFMAMELRDGSLSGVKGAFELSAPFVYTKQQADEFDKSFQ